MSPGIVELPGQVAALPEEAREAFNRIFSVEVAQGILKPPLQMLPWIKQQFGTIEGVTNQTVVKVTNLFTLESSVYNTLRALRPRHYRSYRNDREPVVEDAEDPFAEPLLYTPEDSFGRVKGRHCITAGNVAKYEGYHGVIIFNEFDPLKFGYEEVTDYLETGWKWARRAHGYDPEAQYYLFLWNCTHRAGASMPHGHAQVVLGKGRHFAKAEQLRQAAVSYKSKYKREYFDDLFLAHKSLGLGWQHGKSRIMVYLAPLKLNEVMILSTRGSDGLADAVYRVLECFRDNMQVKSFNLGIAYPPFDDSAGWEGFPVVARMLDRGDAHEVSSDIGAMEFYGANVINNDPFVTAQHVERVLKRNCDN